MNQENKGISIKIMLADDDKDDCYFFEKALKEINIDSELTIVNDGEELMNYLSDNPERLPDIIFLDLSMPRKTGFECLYEMKEINLLKVIPVILLSTSYPKDLKYENQMIEILHNLGARNFIRKRGDYGLIKKQIQHELEIILKTKVKIEKV